MGFLLDGKIFKDLSSVTSLGLAWPAAKQNDANDGV